MLNGVTTLRERLERGYGMRAQRLVEGLLLAASVVSGDLRPAWIAFALLAAQALVSALASPIALGWALAAPGVPADALGNLYYDLAGSRGAAAVSCLVIGVAFALSQAGFPIPGRLLLGAPCASCILSATVGFCAGCGYYVLCRDLLVRAGIIRGAPEGATDVDLERD